MEDAVELPWALSDMSTGKAEPCLSRQRHSCRLSVIEIMSAADSLPLETNWIVSKVFRNDGFHSMWYVWRSHFLILRPCFCTLDCLLICSVLGSTSSFRKVKHCSREEELTIKEQFTMSRVRAFHAMLAILQLHPLNALLAPSLLFGCQLSWEVFVLVESVFFFKECFPFPEVSRKWPDLPSHKSKASFEIRWEFKARSEHIPAN